MTFKVGDIVTYNYNKGIVIDTSWSGGTIRLLRVFCNESALTSHIGKVLCLSEELAVKVGELTAEEMLTHEHIFVRYAGVRETTPPEESDTTLSYPAVEI